MATADHLAHHYRHHHHDRTGWPCSTQDQTRPDVLQPDGRDLFEQWRRQLRSIVRNFQLDCN